MKTLIIILFTFLTTPVTWLGNYNDATQKAKNEHKLILISFSGSDWCIPCMRLRKEILETEAFEKAIHKLEVLGNKKRVAYMCSEAVWWSCHRSLVSDYLKIKGWTVMHIMDTGKAEEHPYTKPAKIEGDKLVYS